VNFSQINGLCKIPYVIMRGCLDQLCKYLSLWEHFKSFCEEKFGVMYKIDHRVIFSILGQIKVI